MMRSFCAVIACAGLAQGALASNILVNPGFESGMSGWSTFGNVFPESASPPAIEPRTGNGLAKMFGNFSGGFNVSGFFQEFSAAPGSEWEISGWARHFSGDAMVGGGAPAANWVVMKIAFFNSANTEIGGAERTILDGTFATDTWHFGAPVLGIAPAGTAKVQALFLYLQPTFDGGAAQIDDASFALIPAPGSMVILAVGGLAAMRRRR